MAKITVSGTLSSVTCPLLSRHVRQPAIVAKYDINYNKHVGGNDKDEDKETTLPIISYAENVLPTHYGYKSANFIQAVPAISATAEVRFAEPVALGDGTVYIYAYVVDPVTTTNTGHWVCKADLTWQKLAAETFTGSPAITLAILSGRCFIHFAGVKTKELTTGAIADIALTGLTATAILGIFASSGYLLVWIGNTIYWSALEDPVDFVASDVTGAGSASLQEARGSILHCRGHINGFMVFCDLNAVYAQASTDFRFPFIFKEVAGVAGIANVSDVSTGAPNELYVRSGPVIAKVQKLQAASVLQELNSLIQGRLIETFSGSAFVETPVANVAAKLATIPGSLVIASFGDSAAAQFAYATYYSSELNRHTKLAIPHKHVVMWPFDASAAFNLINYFGSTLYSTYETATSASLAQSAIIESRGNSTAAFIALDGSINILSDTLDYPAAATLIFGPYQVIRDAMSMLTQVELAAAQVANLTVKILTSLSGAQIDSVTTLTPGRQFGNKARYDTRITGLNHYICVQGSFDLSSILLQLVPRGKVR